jgi:phytoene dehydrogenase-like protein
MRRRDFLLGASATGLLAACGVPDHPKLPPGVLTGPNHLLGHRLRRPASADFPKPTETRRVDVAIIGGGIGGLSAAWRLARAGVSDFLLLDMESEPGGNSRASRNAVSPYPLGAHYLPLPPREAVAVRELLRELGALKGSGDHLGDYAETLLAAAPQERLFIDGWWQEGLWPTHRVPATEREQYARFQDFVAGLRAQRGQHGSRPFALPLALSSGEWRSIDKVNFRDWLLGAGYTAPGLHWLANYACRDDYGTDYSATSAWAGLHYFACRDDDGLEGHVLTTPGGNAWLAEGLARSAQGRVVTSAAVFHVEQSKHGVNCDVFLAAKQRSIHIEARQLIWAAPIFLIPHVFANPRTSWNVLAKAAQYAPWVVVNLTLSAMPHTRAGSPLAWDNVIHDSDSLGYVVAPHQAARYAPGPTVITWYRALHEVTVPPSRQHRLLDRDYWAAAALADLSRPHPEIRELVTQIDVHSHGHAMIRPTPGTLWHPGRAALTQGNERIQFAHADVSGLSLFEEANYQGIRAAEAVLGRLGHRVESALV